MLFTGQSDHTIDAKLRLAIPARFRNQWQPERDGVAWFCMPWPTGHLRLFTEGYFARLSREQEESLAPRAAVADLESAMFSFAERIEPDAAGRIVVPRRHLELAKVGSVVMLVGARNRLEVHDKGRWEASERARFEQMQTLVEEIERNNTRKP